VALFKRLEGYGVTYVVADDIYNINKYLILYDFWVFLFVFCFFCLWFLFRYLVYFPQDPQPGLTLKILETIGLLNVVAF